MSTSVPSFEPYGYLPMGQTKLKKSSYQGSPSLARNEVGQKKTNGTANEEKKRCSAGFIAVIVIASVVVAAILVIAILAMVWVFDKNKHTTSVASGAIATSGKATRVIVSGNSPQSPNNVPWNGITEISPSVEQGESIDSIVDRLSNAGGPEPTVQENRPDFINQQNLPQGTNQTVTVAKPSKARVFYTDGPVNLNKLPGFQNSAIETPTIDHNSRDVRDHQDILQDPNKNVGHKVSVARPLQSSWKSPPPANKNKPAPIDHRPPTSDRTGIPRGRVKTFLPMKDD